MAVAVAYLKIVFLSYPKCSGKRNISSCRTTEEAYKSVSHSYSISPSPVSPSAFFFLPSRSFISRLLRFHLFLLRPHLSLSLFFALRLLAVPIGHEQLCWVNVYSLIIYPFCSPLPFWPRLFSTPTLLHTFPPLISAASEFLLLSPPPSPPPSHFFSRYLSLSGCTVAHCWVALLKLDDSLGY